MPTPNSRNKLSLVDFLINDRFFSVLMTVLLALSTAGLIYQIGKDGSATTALIFFPQWLLLGSLLVFWRPKTVPIVYLPAPVGWLIGFLGALFLATLPLIVAWLGWAVNYLYIGGVLPWTDAADYYTGAENLLQTGELDAWSQRRPINAILLAARLLLAGDNFQIALLMQAWLFGLAAFLAAITVARTFGTRTGMLMFVFMLAYAAPALPTTNSECLGLTIGALAFAVLWWAVIERKMIAYCFGVFLLAFALAVRPGAMFVLPALAVFSGWQFRDQTRFRTTIMVLALVSALLPIMLSYILTQMFGDGTGTASANFSYTLYGLVVGGKGWRQYDLDFPLTLLSLSEAEASHFIYSRAWDHFLAHPIDLLKGISLGFIIEPFRFFAQMVRQLFLGIYWDPLRIVPTKLIIAFSLINIPMLFSGILRFAIIKRPTSVILIFMGIFWTGFLISLPFFYRDGNLRSIAPIFPFVALTLAMALCKYDDTNQKHSQPNWILEKKELPARVSVVIGLAIVMSAIITPVIMPVYTKPAKVTADWHCSANEVPMLVHLKPGRPIINMARWEMKKEKLSFPIWRPVLFQQIPPKGSLFLVFDSITQAWIYLYDSDRFEIATTEAKKICATKNEIYYIVSGP